MYSRDPALSPPRRLRVSDTPVELAAQISCTRDLLDTAYDRATEENASAKDIHLWIALSTRHQALLDAFSRESQRLSTVSQESELADAWKIESEKIEAKLLVSYGSKGVQYEVLCAILAPLVVTIKRSYEGGIRLAPEQRADLTRTANQVIAQLQKHTETTKTENHQLVESIAVKVLAVVERNLGHQPRTLQRIVNEVRGELEGARLALPAGREEES